jgi:superfamily II DNA or RNA helicase
VDSEHDPGSPPLDAELLGVELAAAYAEIDRLRGLLGLPSLAAAADRPPTTVWEPTLFAAEPGPAIVVNDGSSNADKVALFASRFSGRVDVYATRWESGSGKAGWSPAVKGGWSGAKAKVRQYLPLTDDVLAAHLRGDISVGIYPLLRGDSCRFLACDFDRSSWALDALAFLDACRDVGVPAALERSRSGNGAHVWIFFAEAVPASTARSLGAGLLRQAMARRVEIDLASYDRLFPSQDFVPKGSFGNLIALPLQGAARRANNTCFLDPSSLEPWPDQWQFLSSVEALSAEATISVASAVGGFELGPDMHSRGRWKSMAVTPVPASVSAQLGGQLSLVRAGLPAPLVAELKHLASLHNPEFYEKQKMRFSTWSTPRIIRCYEEDLDLIHFPRGLTDRIGRLLRDAGSNLDVVDVRPDPPSLDVTFQGRLDDIQERAVDVMAGHDLGILVAPPGTGKTVMGCALIARHHTPTLVLCDRHELIDQWRARLLTHLDLEPGDIGQIGAGKKRTTHRVDIATIQSLARKADPAAAFDGYGLVIVDECHHLPAVSFDQAVRRGSVRRWLGLTATPYRRDGLEGILKMQCGPVRHEISAKATAAASMRLELVVHETLSDPVPVDNPPIQQLFKGLVEDHERNAMICDDVAAAVTGGRNCLVLTQRTEHIDRLVAGLAERETSALVLKGGLGKKARTAVRDVLDDESARGLVLVGTGSYLGEGFDWPTLDTLFLAAPMAWRGRVEQYAGRLLRAHADKTDVEVHDYVDVLVPVLARMHIKRLSGYAKLGFDVRAARRASRS